MIPIAFLICGLFMCHESHSMSMEAMRRLSLIRNVTELFELVNIQRNGQRVSLHDVLPYFAKDGDKMYISPGVAELAIPDECSPRPSTVDIPRQAHSSNTLRDESANEVMWPTCTRVKRCGGCCANKMLECVPLRTRPKTLTVLKATLYDSPQMMMNWEGAAQVQVEEHLNCMIMCRITAADCNSRQRFDAYACSCTCRRPEICRPWQRWDTETCRCVCTDETISCRPGSIFSTTTCRCHIDRNQEYSNLAVDENVEDTVQQDEANTTSSNETGTTQTTVTDTTTTTTTTTTTVPTTSDPCATQFCPPNFIKNPTPTGGCVCTPNFTFGGLN